MEALLTFPQRGEDSEWCVAWSLLYQCDWVVNAFALEKWTSISDTTTSHTLLCYFTGPFLAAIFQSVEERSGQRFPFSSSDLRIHSVRIKNFPSVVIQLPEPQETAEAFLVALVITMSASPQNATSNQQSVARYFALEKGFTLTDEARTVLAEWTTDRHSNYGDGPVATVDAFCQAISQHV